MLDGVKASQHCSRREHRRRAAATAAAGAVLALTCAAPAAGRDGPLPLPTDGAAATPRPGNSAEPGTGPAAEPEADPSGLLPRAGGTPAGDSAGLSVRTDGVHVEARTGGHCPGPSAVLTVETATGIRVRLAARQHACTAPPQEHPAPPRAPTPSAAPTTAPPDTPVPSPARVQQAEGATQSAPARKKPPRPSPSSSPPAKRHLALAPARSPSVHDHSDARLPMVTHTLLIVTPAVLAAAALRPRSGSRGSGAPPSAPSA